MDDAYQISHDPDPQESAWGFIGRSLSQYNKEQGGDNQYQRICLVLRDPEQTIAGGLIGATYWGWLYIDLLWLREDLRGLGYGHRLLTAAEDEARQRGAANAYLDTFDFQAPEFYQQHGYRVFGQLEDFPPGHRRFFMTKQL
jgi:GNAT superfamily N-acetyltransferase